jgi:hypothetical protein
MKSEDDLQRFGRNQKPTTLNFKWSPCSIKADFDRLMCKSQIPSRAAKSTTNTNETRGQKWPQLPIYLDNRPKLLLNHLEYHKELTRKDDLINNLKTQLQHDNENLFDYTPVSFVISIPEGKYSTIDVFLQKFLSCFETFNVNKARFKELMKNEM